MLSALHRILHEARRRSLFERHKTLLYKHELLIVHKKVPRVFLGIVRIPSTNAITRPLDNVA